jgi:hypothetical protein
MTVEQVNKIIEREIKASGGVRALGRKWGVKPAQITKLRMDSLKYPKF